MALLPIVCTATVENGSDLVEVSGTDASTGAAVVLTDINCRPNATVFLAGVGYLVAERVDTTSLRLERDYAGADASGVSCTIAPFTPEMANRAELATALRTTTALTQLLQARGNGLHYFALGATGSGDPGAGKVSYVGASWAAASALCIDVLDAVGRSRAGLLARWKLGDTLIVESIATASYVAYELTEAPSSQDSGAWYLLENFTLVASDGALVDGEAVRLVELAAGDLGPAYTYNEEVANVAARAAYDDEAAGFRVFVKDSGVNGRSAVDQRTGSAGTWERLAYYTGPKGDKGDAGWAPKLVVVTDGERRVFQLDGYVGGQGTAPTTNVGDYLKADGTFTATIGEAADVRGAPGADGDDGYDGVSFIWRAGGYNSGTAYAANDVIRDQGAAWIALQATTGNAPPTLPTASNAYWELMAAKGEDGAGSGDVVGPASATNNAIALFDGVGGKLLKDSAVTIIDEDDMSSDSASAVPTQQSVKAYVDANAGGSIPFTAASSSGPAQLDLAEDTDSGSNKVALKAPSALAANRNFVLPDADVTLSAYIAALLNSTTAAGSQAAIGVREVLTADRTYYVRADGSDSNNGLANTSGGAFLTIQKALTVAAALDGSTYNVTTQVGAGTWTVPVVLPSYIGSGVWTLIGDTTTPSNVTVSVSTGMCIGATAVINQWRVRGFKVVNSGGVGIGAASASNIVYDSIEFGACSTYQVWSSMDSYVEQRGSCTISGGGTIHAFCEIGSIWNPRGQTITITTPVTFSSAFAVCANGYMRVGGPMTFTNPSNVTGKRYNVTLNGVISTGGGGASYFPGDVAGTDATGGQYV